jgi:S1-C subfamily serine protease
VTFPKTTLPYPARLVRESIEVDVALLKIDVLDTLQGVPKLDSDYIVKPGDAVTVLGYPAISEQTWAVIKSKDPINSGDTEVNVPAPTVTGGWVGKINKINPEIKSQVKAENEYYGSMDSYQLTINATGQGNSGGPVFNDRGKVIGIFSYVKQQDGITISFAVPIEYGRKLRLNSSELQ